MNILGLVFSASLSALERNDSRTKCPVVDISSPLENKTRKASKGVKCQEHPSDYGCSKKSKSSGYVGDCSRELTDVSNTSSRSLSLLHDEPAKKTSKKKKRRKGKSNKLHLDNNIVSGTVDMSKISLNTGLVECHQSKATLCNQTTREVIGKSVHDKVDAKLDTISSESTLNSERSNHFLNLSGTECFTSISKLSSEIAALQDPASGHKNIDGTCNMKFSRNRENSIKAAQGSSTITCVTASEPIVVFLEDARDSNTKSASTVSSSLDKSNLIGAHVAPGNDNCRRTETCEKLSNGVRFGTETGTQNEVIADASYCIVEYDMEPPCSRSLSADSRECRPGNLHTSLGAKEADRYGSRKDVKSNNQCSKISESSEVVTIQNSFDVKEANKKYSNMEVTSSHQCSAVHDVPDFEHKENSQISDSTSRIPFHMNFMNKIGKENANFTWKRTGRYIGSSQTDGRKISDHNHLCIDAASSDTTSISKHSSSNGDSLLPFPHMTHCTKDGFQQKGKYSTVGIQKMYKTRGRMFVEASEWATREIFHARHGQYVLGPRNDVVGNSSWERSKNKLTLPSKQENANHSRKGLWVGKPNLCKTGRRTFLHEIKYDDGGGTTSTEGVKSEPFHVSLIEEDKSSVCSEVVPCNSSTKALFTSRVNLTKWIPVCKNDSLMLKTSRGIDHTNTGKVNHHREVDNQEVNNDAFFGASRVLDINKDMHMSNGLDNARLGNLGKGKNDYCSEYKLKNLPIFICSDLAEQALKASYIKQIASESFQLATGSPIAEFEKLLYTASPVIASSSFQQLSNDVLKHEFISASFIKFLKPSFALRDVWNWYEGPGNYGLHVKAEDSQNSKGLEANVSFNAHFVPFLSAIQLFGRHCHSVGSSSGDTSDSMPESGDTEERSFNSSSLDISLDWVAETSSPDHISSEKHMRPSGIATTDESGCSASASFCLSDDSHVIFEYFEHEPPQQRKPLLAKIKELLDGGTSNSQVFGDPSKLECLDLQDLHPASWFSVAWYPIYRIPEGGFRASFLTYHSLGHLYLRCTEPDSVEEAVFCVVSPALGMQSYNTQGECWFYPKKPAEYLLKDGNKPADISELLKERLTTLEETAALFSRGHVRKAQTTAINKHPDYEFFLSRKR